MLGQESPVGSHVSTGLGTMLLGVSGNCDDREVTSLPDELPSEPDSENDTCIERGESLESVGCSIAVSMLRLIYSFDRNLIKCQSFTYDLQLTFTKAYTTLACCKITDNMATDNNQCCNNKCGLNLSKKIPLDISRALFAKIVFSRPYNKNVIYRFK